MPRNPFSRKLPYTQVLIVFFAFAVMAFASYLYVEDITRGYLRRVTESMLVTVESRLYSDMNELETMLNVVSETVRGMITGGLPFEAVEEYITAISGFGRGLGGAEGFLAVSGYFNVYGGRVVDGGGPDSAWGAEGERNPGSFAWYSEAVAANGRVIVTNPYVDAAADTVTVTIARALFDEAGNRIAVMCLDVSVDRIFSSAISNYQYDEGYWMLFDKNLVAIAHPRSEFLEMSLADIPSEFARLADELRRYDIIERRITNYHDETKIVNFRQLENGWYLGVATRVDVYYASLSLVQRFLIVLAFVTAAGLSVILVRISRRGARMEEEQNKLQDEHQTLLHTFDKLPIAVRVIDLENFELTYANKATKDLFGFDGGESIVGRNAMEFMPENQPDGTPTEQFSRDVSIPESVIYEVQCKRKDGGLFVARISSITMMFNGKPSSLATVEDLTNELQYRKMVTERETESAQNELQLIKLNMAMRAASIGLWDMEVNAKDPTNELNKITWSDEFRKILGYEDETDFPNVIDSFHKILHPDDLLWVPHAISAHIMDRTGLTPYNADYRVIKKNGDIAHIRATGETVRDEHGNPLRVAGTIIDVTALRNLITEAETRRVEAETANKENEVQLLKLNLAIRAAKIGLWDMEIVTDNPLDTANTVTWSDELRRIFGFETVEDFPNTLDSFHNVLHPDDLLWVPQAAIAHITDKTDSTPYDVEYRVIKKNGEMAYIRASGKTIRDAKGNPMRVAGTLMDLTEMKELINEAERQRVKAENANKTKSEFLSHISHEIRTPMNAVIGAAEIQLQKGGHQPDAEEALHTIYNSGNLLLNIINDILDLSKIEAGKMEVVPVQYDIASLIYDTMQLNMMRYESKDIEFKLEINENTPLNLIGDELRIKQILNNILSNAFKYTDSGTVKLSVSTSGIPSSGILQFAVEDTGQGMDEEQLSRLFSEYARFNMNNNRSIVGTGLGMSITKRLIDLLNGEIAIISEPGKGSTFTVRIPQERIGTDVCGKEIVDRMHSNKFRQALKVKRSAIVHEYMPYGKVLVVDDVESNLYVAKGMLLPYGLNIETVTSGFAALDKVKAGSVYDIIFMDHMMPQMDGMKTVALIRELGYAAPIVALTANAVTGLSEMFLANGFDGFITKPIDIRELNVCLNRLIKDKQPAEVIESARRSAVNQTPVKPKSISDELMNAALMDIDHAVTVLNGVLQSVSGEPNLELYSITTHGMYGALLNIGEPTLAQTARNLENAGIGGDIALIAKETPAFINSLLSLTDKIKTTRGPAKEVIARAALTDAHAPDAGSVDILRAKLTELTAHCEQFRIQPAKKILDELKAGQWTAEVNAALDEITLLLRRGELKKIAAIAGTLTEKL
jgi:PAS domain S-box-containing protein